MLLSVPDEDALLDQLDRICYAGLVYSSWCEPDWDNAHTAVAVAPSEEARLLFAQLPLALRKEELV